MFKDKKLNQWADQAITIGRPAPTGPMTTWEDFDLAQHFKYMQDQIQRLILDFQTLQIWPKPDRDLNSRLKDVILEELAEKEEEYYLVCQEIKRRWIP